MRPRGGWLRERRSGRVESEVAARGSVGCRAPQDAVCAGKGRARRGGPWLPSAVPSCPVGRVGPGAYGVRAGSPTGP